MLRHIVMFKMKELPATEKAEGVARLKAAVDAMEAGVPQVKYLQTGVNFNPRPQAFDLVLVSDFASEEDLDIYRDHPMHQKVMDVIHDVVEKVHVVDFWI
jgi:hypothetical protein